MQGSSYGNGFGEFLCIGLVDFNDCNDNWPLTHKIKLMFDDVSFNQTLPCYSPPDRSLYFNGLIAHKKKILFLKTILEFCPKCNLKSLHLHLFVCCEHTAPCNTSAMMCITHQSLYIAIVFHAIRTPNLPILWLY